MIDTLALFGVPSKPSPEHSPVSGSLHTGADPAVDISVSMTSLFLAVQAQFTQQVIHKVPDYSLSRERRYVPPPYYYSANRATPKDDQALG